MMSRTAIFAGVVSIFAVTSIASAAGNNTRLSYVGGHDPARLVRVEPRSETDAPYALTGRDSTRSVQRTEPIRIGSRFVGVRMVNR